MEDVLPNVVAPTHLWSALRPGAARILSEHYYACSRVGACHRATVHRCVVRGCHHGRVRNPGGPLHLPARNAPACHGWRCGGQHGHEHSGHARLLRAPPDRSVCGLWALRGGDFPQCLQDTLVVAGYRDEPVRYRLPALENPPATEVNHTKELRKKTSKGMNTYYNCLL